MSKGGENEAFETLPTVESALKLPEWAMAGGLPHCWSF